MISNTKVAAAIAAVLATGSVYAGQPSPSQAASPTVGLYIAGSSAAKNAVLGSLETSFCGGSYSLFSSTGNTNFFAVSCTPAATTGVPSANGTNVFTIWYRTEGGSVVGALPLVSGKSINQLSLAGAAGSAGSYTVPVSGSSGTNGIDDSFGSGVSPQPVQLGITDVEPTAFISDNYPKAYSAAVYGKATPSTLNNLTASTLFDQVFGVFVNTNSSAFSASETGGQGKAAGAEPAGTTLNLPKETITNILQGATTNWNKAADATGAAVTTASLPITIVNREQGSGTRTGTSIFFTEDECNKAATSIKESTNGTADSFSTGDVLTAANNIPGSITYASIDQAGSTSFPNLTLVEINGVFATNLNAAAGTYGDWFEATAVTGPNLTNLSADQQGLISTLIADFQASPPFSAQILGIPGNEGAAALPVTSTATSGGGKTIYINPFTRAGVSCNTPGSAL